ncbi:MAG: hypothetical protein JO128_12145 [Alphaproteobacteria bacterium]|nr:hypothetical protein [Alphaproteobacteria bacterium]
MTERLPNLTELRAQARRHRDAAARETDPHKRKARLDLAAEYEKLVQEVEDQKELDN